MLLSDAKIRGVKPNGKTFRLKDGDGLFLVIRPNGKKFWQFRYRFLDKEKTLSLGKYPQVRLIDARNKKIDAMRLLIDRVDPSSHRKQERALAIFRDRNSFGAVAEEWLERNSGIWTARHQQACRSRLEMHVLPKLGSRPIAEILPLELLSVVQEIETSGATYMAHRCLQFCGSVYNYAIITGRTRSNITIGLSKALRPHREKHHPTLTAKELPEFLHALAALQTSEQNKLAFRLLLLTAVRTGELRHSKWTDIDFEAKEWSIRPEIMKMRRAHLVPLSRQAIQILRRLHSITGHSEWIVPSQQSRVHPVMSENTINDMIKRMGYKDRIVGHGFRSLFSTILNEHGFNRDAIERQLAHMERNAVRAAYNRAEYMEDRREIMQWWADFIDGQTNTANRENSFNSTKLELAQQTNLLRMVPLPYHDTKLYRIGNPSGRIP